MAPELTFFLSTRRGEIESLQKLEVTPAVPETLPGFTRGVIGVSGPVNLFQNSRGMYLLCRPRIWRCAGAYHWTRES